MAPTALFEQIQGRYPSNCAPKGLFGAKPHDRQDVFLFKDREPQAYEDLQDILRRERIASVFQPIVDIHSAEVYGYEALSRIVGTSIFPFPAALFRAAQHFGLTWELEKLCRTRALKAAHALGLNTFLTINVCPSVLQASNHKKGTTAALVEELFEVRDSIIIELTERFAIKDHELFKETVNHYRKQGFKIGIDDLGSGSAGLKTLAQIEPFMVKIDRFLIGRIDRSTKKQLLLEALISFCHKVGARVVAEGVETEQELEAVMAMKVDLVQGFFLARPEPYPQKCSARARKCILRSYDQVNAGWYDSNLIGSLAVYMEPATSDELVASIAERFKKTPGLTALPVMKDHIPVGIIHKTKLFYRLGQKYGYDLYSRRSASQIMESALIFESTTPLEEVSQKVLERNEEAVYDAVIVTRNGLYVGIVQIHHILERISRQKVQLAIQANPLTGLPGNNMIKEEIIKFLNIKQIFSVLYFDLDHFKPFNDTFGFERGDQVIRLVANLLKDVIHQWDIKSFLGHVGGDDFVAICRSDEIETLCQTIIGRFDREVRTYHDAEAIKKGYYESKNRRGDPQQFPLLSISIAVVSTADRAFASYGQLVSVASEVKKHAKAQNGSSYSLDRRRH